MNSLFYDITLLLIIVPENNATNGQDEQEDLHNTLSSPVDVYREIQQSSVHFPVNDINLLRN